jgi:hypothetical protein
MAALYPLLLVAAAVIGWRRRGLRRGHGWRWFLCWAGAGFLLSFSFVTGLSIGLLFLPLAAAVLFFASVRAPHAREASGFLVGLGLTVLLLVVL